MTSTSTSTDPTSSRSPAATFDAIVIGGGAAGSSAAMVLGRARASVVLVDDRDPSNAPSTGIGGLLGNDGTTPEAFYARVGDELAAYPSIQRVEATASAIEAGRDRRWRVRSSDDELIGETDHVVLAMGMRYDRPDLDGLAPLWGASVFHCPFCHGWEHRDEPMAIFGGDPHAPMVARLLRRWSDDVVFIDNGVTISADDRAGLDELGVPVVEGTIVALEGDGRALHTIVLDDGRRLARGAMLLPAPHTFRHPALIEPLGLATTGDGHIEAAEMGQTSVPGIWAVGDLTSPMASVARVIAAGHACGAGITFDLAGLAR